MVNCHAGLYTLLDYFQQKADANSEPDRRAGPTCCEYGGGREGQRGNPLAGRPMRAHVRARAAGHGPRT
jgi:hypothetical protein